MPSRLRLLAALSCAGLAWLPVVIGSVLIGAALTGPVHAQETPVPIAEVGSTIRLTIRGEAAPIEGTLLSASYGTWTISRLGSSPRVVETDEVVETQIKRQRRRSRTGMGVGMSAGLLLGAVWPTGCDPDALLSDLCEGFTRAGSFISFLVLGSVAGTVVGAFITTERWIPAALPPSATPEAALELRWIIPIGGSRRRSAPRYGLTTGGRLVGPATGLRR